MFGYTVMSRHNKSRPIVATQNFKFKKKKGVQSGGCTQELGNQSSWATTDLYATSPVA